MSSNLKAQLKTLLDRKEYTAAIALLEASALPDRQKYIQRIRQRIEDEAPVPAKQEKAKRSRGTTCAYIAAIIIVILCGAVLLIYQFLNAPIDGLPRQQWSNRLNLESYCDYIEAPQASCKQWADEAIRADPIAAQVCFELYSVYRETENVSHCLVGLGLSPVPGQTVIRDVEISDWSVPDYGVLDMLERYCDGERNIHYCAAWTWLTYRDYRSEIWGCSQQHRNNQVGFTNCVISLGVKA